MVAAAAAAPGPEEDGEEFDDDKEFGEYEEGEEGAEVEAGAATEQPAAAAGAVPDGKQQQQQQQGDEGDEEEDGEGDYNEGEFEEEAEGAQQLVEGEGGYPEPPARANYLSDLLAMASEEGLAKEIIISGEGVNTVVFGLQHDLSRVVTGDLFVCHLSFDLGRGIVDRHEQVADAVLAGATAVLASVEHRQQVEEILAAMPRRPRGGAEQQEGEEGEHEGSAERAAAAGEGDDDYYEGEEEWDEAAAEEEEEDEERRRGGGASSSGQQDAGGGPEGQGWDPVPGVKVINGVPVVFVEDVDDVASKMAMAFYEGPSLDMRVIGVTGTSGKTTVSWLVRGVLEELGQTTGMISSIEYGLAEDRLDDEGDLWEAEEPDPTAERECTSPFQLAPYQGKYEIDYSQDMDGVRIQKLLAGARDRGATAMVVEASTEALSRGWLEYVDVDVAVWTCFEEEPRHLALHDGSQESYLESKLKLFEVLQDPERQRAIVNIDDPMAKRVLEVTSVPTVTYSVQDRRADVWAESMQLTAWETEVIVRVPGGQRLQIISPLVGRHNVYNILAAVAVGIILGAPLEAVVAGIEAVTVIPGRSEVVNSDPEDPVLRGDFPVMVDAADSPARVATILDSLREAGVGRIFTVVGVDGETTNKSMRTQIGAAAFSGSEVVIVTNASPRRELPDEIVADIMDGLPERVVQAYATYVYNPFQDQGRVPLWFEPWLHSAQRTHKRHVIEDRFSAIRAAIGTARPSDAVLLLGQGHRDWVEYWDGNEEEPGLRKGWFDDRVEARNALSKLEYLYSLVNLDRSELPWGHTTADADRSAIWEEPLRDEEAAGPWPGKR